MNARLATKASMARSASLGRGPSALRLVGRRLVGGGQQQDRRPGGRGQLSQADRAQHERRRVAGQDEVIQLVRAQIDGPQIQPSRPAG